MIFLDADTQLTTANMCNIIQYFVTTNLPKLQKMEKYYLGKHDILNRTFTDTTKPNNKMAINYPQLIADAYSSYLVGTPVSYTANSNNDKLQEILNYNDVANCDLETATDANIFGYGINQLYMDEDSQIRFCRIKPTECILVYDNTLNENLLYAIRFYPVTNINDLSNTFSKYNVEVYDKTSVTYYTADNLFSSLIYIDSAEHYFKDIPFVEFKNNEYRQSSFEQIIPLVDCLEKINSDAVNTWEQFADAYMFIRGMTAEQDDIQNMKENRVIIAPDKECDVSYLTKDMNVEQIQNLQNDIITHIHKISGVPDMTDENFVGNASGVAIRYKILGFENATAKKERKFKKGLQRRIELIYNIMSLTDGLDSYLGVKITFTRNLPENALEQAQMVNTLRGVVSDKTLLAQLPFVEDAQAEAKAVDKQKQDNVATYGFGSSTDDNTSSSGSDTDGE